MKIKNISIELQIFEYIAGNVPKIIGNTSNAVDAPNKS
jgi:hypothetical protein